MNIRRVLTRPKYGQIPPSVIIYRTYSQLMHLLNIVVPINTIHMDLLKTLHCLEYVRSIEQQWGIIVRDY